MPRALRHALLKAAVLIAAVSAVFVFTFKDAATPAPFSYDESDYMAVARKGPAENYLETTSMSAVTFAQTGLKAVRGQIGKTGLSEYIRRIQDLTFLRHYHGPLYYQWLVISRWLGGGSEHSMRLFGLLLHLMTFATIVAGVPLVFGPEALGAGWLAGILYVFCVNNIETATELSSHVIFMWLSILTLLAIAAFAKRPSRRRFYVAFACCAVSLCALEYAVLLFACLLAAGLLVRHHFFTRWSGAETRDFALTCCGILLAVLLLLWPAAIFRGTLIEGFAYIIYLSKFRKGSFGDMTPVELWKNRFEVQTADFVIATLCIIAVAVLIWRSPQRRMIAPIFLFSVLMLATTMKNTSTAPRYISSIFAPLDVSAAVLICERLRRVPAWALAAATLLLAGGLAYSAWTSVIRAAREPRPPNEYAVMIRMVRETNATKLMVPSVYKPTLSYYFPEREIRSFVVTEDRDTIQSAIAQQMPGVACVYGWQALPGPTVLKMSSAAGEVICTSR